MCAQGGGGLLAGRRRILGGACSPHEGQPLLGRSGAPGALARARIRGGGQLHSGTGDPAQGRPPPPQPGRRPEPTVAVMVPFHRPRMLRPGVQDLPGPGRAQCCPPCWGAVLGPWRFWASHLLALQSWRHRDSCPSSGSARCWGSNLCDEGGRDISHPPPPHSLLEQPRPLQGGGTSPTSPLWDPPPGALRVRGLECAQIKPSPTAPAEQSRDPGPHPQVSRLRPAPPCPAHQDGAHIRAHSGPRAPQESQLLAPSYKWLVGSGKGAPPRASLNEL